MTSDVELPKAYVETVGEHITIKSYRIANVRLDGNLMEDWTPFFAIDNQTGTVSVIKNQAFAAGTYVFDLRLMTTVYGAEAEEGVFSNALTIDVVSPPVSLKYNPPVKRVEEGMTFVSLKPECVASSKNLTFELKSVYPADVPLTVDAATGVVTLAAENGLVSGDKVFVSVRVTNAVGTKDFDQVLIIEIVDFIAPVTKLSYNDSTLWHNTEMSIKPIEVDGDDVRFSFSDLPDALSMLTIDEETGQIDVPKGNAIPLGDYIVTIKVENDKGPIEAEWNLKVIANPYFFTKVSWGNNLGLPVDEHASQHRVSLSEETLIPVLMTNSDITEQGWTNISFEMIDGSLRLGKDAKIDATTGEITVMPSYIAGKGIAFKRAHVAIIQITVGAGTTGETVRKVPVFFDFNAPRYDSSNATAPVYTVEFNPFVFLCNPKTGGTFVTPVIKDQSGEPLSAETLAKVSMTLHGPNTTMYWNLDGPQTHLNGSPAAGNFLGQLWEQYYKNVSPKKTAQYGNSYPVYSYLTDDITKQEFWASARLGYIQNIQNDPISEQDHLRLYIVPEKWVDGEGYYADGIFTGRVTLGYPYMDDSGNEQIVSAANSKTPYIMYPIFIWFDTEF